MSLEAQGMDKEPLNEVNRLNLVIYGMHNRTFDRVYILNLADQIECGRPQSRETLIGALHYCAEYLGDENLLTFEVLEPIYKYAAPSPVLPVAS